jgi:prepilin-type N-terminal cleavage/methylation domain-containing protein/prepilin-type processing-associated H-X9-DG protein
MLRLQQQQRQPVGSRGFTLVELLVVIGVIAILISILIPALTRARDQANRAACMSNIRQVMLGFILYAQQNKDKCPYGSRLDNPGNVDIPGDWIYWRPVADPNAVNNSAIVPFLNAKSLAFQTLMRCPSDRGQDRITGSTGNYSYSYVMNMYFEPRAGFYPAEGGPPIRLSTTKRASEKILLAEENEKTINDGFWAPGNYTSTPVPGNWEANWVVNWDWLSIRHDNQKKEVEPAVPNTGPLANLPNKDRMGVVCFADGHVDLVPRRYAHSPLHLLPRLDP